MTGVQARTDVTIRELALSGSPKSLDNETFVTSSAAAAGSITDTTSYAVADQDTKALGITIDGGTVQAILFDITVTTALLVAQQLNDQLTGASAGVVGGQVVVTSDSVGINSSVAVTDGTSDLTWDTAVAGTGATAVAKYTVVSRNPATRKWSALTDVTASDGTEYPRGVYIGDAITAAALQAADVTGKKIMIGGPVTVDEDVLVLQNSVALTDEITNLNITVRDAMNAIGIFPEATVFVSSTENA